jgi:hypothetical protein
MKEISELHIRKEINVEGNGKVRLTIESFNSLHRKEYTLSPAMWAASEVLQDKVSRPGSMYLKDTFSIYRVGAYDVMIISSVNESPYLTLERLSLAEKIAWLPFGIENVQQVEDTRHSNSQHVSYLRIIQ